MKVDIGVQEFLAEGVEFTGVTLRDRAVAQGFAHEGAVLGFCQAVVVAVPRAGLGELHAPFLPQVGDRRVDGFRAVIGVKAEDPEGEVVEQGFEHGQQGRPVERLAGGDNLELGHAVHGIAVIEAFHAVLIPLGDTVDTDETRTSIGGRGAPLGDGNRIAPGLGPVQPPRLLARLYWI